MPSIMSPIIKYLSSGGTRFNLPTVLEALPEKYCSKNLVNALTLKSMIPNFTMKEADKLIKGFLTPVERAKVKLNTLYSDIIRKSGFSGNIRREQIFTIARKNIDNLSSRTIYDNLLETLYKESRIAEYPNKFLNPHINKITQTATEHISVRAENGWHYRIPKNYNGKAIERVSVNSTSDENLIRELDELFASGSVKGYYKTPENPADWLCRHDPVTIYLYEKATPETLARIKNTCEKYIRSKDDVLEGYCFEKGMALQQSPTKESIAELLERAKQIDPELEECFRRNFTDRNTGELKTSAGYFTAAEKILKDLS